MEKVFTIQEDGVRLDRYLRRIFGDLPQSLIEKSLRKRLVTLDKEKVISSTRVKAGQVLRVYSKLCNAKVPVKPSTNKVDERALSMIKKSIIYEDDNVLAINKPFGLPVQSGVKIKESIDNIVKSIYPDIRVVHRLDQHTTGALLFAKNLKTTTEFWRLFKSREIKKKYIAIVVGKMEKSFGRIENFIKKSLISGEELMQCNETDGDIAITNFKVIKSCHNASLVELCPETGRKHQLRAHMAHIGYPVLSDGKYGRKAAFLDNLDKKMNLHALSLEFTLFEKKIKIIAEEPYHFRENVKLLFG